MLIRKVSPEEFPRSAAVIRESFLTVAHDFGFTQENNPTNGAFIKPEKLIEEHIKGIKMFGLFENEIQIGFMAIENHDDSVYYLEKLAVTPENRHKGYGKNLLDYAKEYIKQMGGNCISAAIIFENDKLLKWYEKNEFVKKSTKVYDNLTFTVCFLECNL